MYEHQALTSHEEDVGEKVRQLLSNLLEGTDADLQA